MLYRWIRRLTYNNTCYFYTCYFRNENGFWSVHGIMNNLGLLQSGFTLTLQETLSIHGSMNRPKIELIT